MVRIKGNIDVQIDLRGLHRLCRELLNYFSR